jgi:cytochrome b6-f complex iron-sulfur subunit
MSDTNTLVSRRQFCAGACQVASCATLATLVTACGGGSPTSPSGPVATLSVVPSQFANSRITVNVAGTALANVGGVARVDSNAGLFLISRTSDALFTAIEGACTHEGCTITGSDGTQYVCPCHGSRYNRTGQVEGGPAKSSLRQYATTFANDVLTITL